MKSWKDLFDWMEMTFYAVVKKNTFHVRLQVVGEKNHLIALLQTEFLISP